uniref:Uncharacterized protein n=1 Tax=Zea mays TaxID=4577 RepID=A0A804LTZ7_MAIZE
MFGAAGSNPDLDIKHISIAGTIGNLTLRAYEDYEFADPAGSLRGLRQFKRNCTNFGSLLEKSNMKLTKWEDLEVLTLYHTIIDNDEDGYLNGVLSVTRALGD